MIWTSGNLVFAFKCLDASNDFDLQARTGVPFIVTKQTLHTLNTTIAAKDSYLQMISHTLGFQFLLLVSCFGSFLSLSLSLSFFFLSL